MAQKAKAPSSPGEEAGDFDGLSFSGLLMPQSCPLQGTLQDPEVWNGRVYKREAGVPDTSCHSGLGNDMKHTERGGAR